MARKYSISFKGELFYFDNPKVMGILNVTPDSFFDGGQYNQEKALLLQAQKHLADGADFLDIGGYSSRPGAKEVPIEEELKRVIPAIKVIVRSYPNALISVDTFRSEVAKKAIEAGACMVNDISGGNLDAEMFSTVKQIQVPYIMMHMQGTPATMQQKPTYENVTQNIIKDLSTKMEKLRFLGVNDVMIDPGFGFGKTVEHNYQLIKELTYFNVFDCPILVGVSRKSMINKVIGTTPETALNGTTALHMLALQNGANILRVHDVKEAIETIKIYDQYKKV